ncbi:KICSTOR complex protein SZT2-like [Corticium candelabrum]|uniref:KICSTOR complex protein SZT2-like n=1 Tax=Corticium candelabrum TaxID=121492 RepID=UPI002E273DAF|nr:KICSTOR complex protein SZT2-like [Corticium candelabrum]
MYHDEVTVTSDQTASIDFGLLDMIHSCTLALQLLSSAASGVVIVSDGVCEFLDVNTADTLLYQLRSFDIACSFLKVGDEFHPQASYGFVSNTHLLRFIAEASGGAHLTVNCLNFEDVFYDPDEGDVVNLYQKLMLCRTIQAVSPNWTARQRSRWSLFEGQLCLPTLMRKRYSEEKIQSDIMRYLGSRVREGFQIRDVFLSKKDTQLEVKIVMPWKEEVKLEYHVVGPWPLNQVE